MPELNLSQAARLYGKSRMTLHRHCGSGRISSRLSHDGQPLIDLSELIRAYGEPPNRVTPETPETPSDQSQRDDLLLRELQALREQVTQLQEEVRALQRLPAPRQLSEERDNAPPADMASRPPGEPIREFGDLLKRFEAKH